MDPGEIDAADVLLVDDDVEWLTLAGRSLESADDALTVLTAASGSEALDLLDRETFDCVVCDYRMPGMDGLEVLNRVRDRHGDLPFILVTASGSEEVASSAIASAVTDYFVKDPGRDQSDTLAARVRSAVASHRTSEALSAARRRFTGLFENVPSPVAIVDDQGGIYRVNDAFERTFGVEGANVEGVGIDVPLDADLGTATGEEAATVESVALSTTEGQRYFLVRRFELGDGSGYVGYAFTDVTDHRKRRETLERALDLDADVRELLVSASSRDRLEASFCESLVEADDVVLAVVADLTSGGDLSVRARAGDAELDLEAGDQAGDPLAAALRDREQRHCPETDGEGWQRRAREAGIGSAFAVPLDLEGMPGGAVGVYADAPDAFDADRRTRLADLVASLGDGIAVVERMGALAADRVIRVRLSVVGGGPLADPLTEEATLTVQTVRRADSGTRLYVEPETVPATDDAGGERTVPAVEDFAALAVVDSATLVEQERHRVRIDTAGGTFVDRVVESGATVHSLRISPQSYEAAVDVPASNDVETVVDEIESAFDRVTVHSIRGQDRTDGTDAAEGFAELTEKQHEALATAYAEGYFEQPRARSAEEVAAAMDISGSTFLQHLRAAQRKLLSSAFEGDQS